ncbi:methyl-accepting chemotaxis protein [Ammoniphilus sp. CFH 90114]|uniref:methyl-accepting chemotaxis protein n=1 Tax=Ammoniphilus sp. CFH 90114 TaxID=2493665 RepID=UPI00100FAA8D|nr:HAMP domain-containing methyl-accepting chemotaxis protein [Ammoniphilus sp. CFH 90114]RXT04289.1 methyl-accepting chemotaxis protein [Ammoniphilus sp. CFH 90114]
MTISRMMKLQIMVIVVLSVVTLGSLYLLHSGVQQQRQADQNAMEFKQLGFDLFVASEFLTNEIRSYVQYAEVVYLDNYYTETNETRTRERVAGRLLELKAPEELVALVKEAGEHADALSRLEAEAIQAVRGQSFVKARELVYGSDYKNTKLLMAQSITNFQQQLEDWANKEAKKAEQKMNLLLLTTVLMFIVIIASVTSSLFILNRKLRPLQQVTMAAHQVAQGNLQVETLPVHSKDEVAQVSLAINQMVDNLRDLIQQIASSSEQVNAYSGELIASAEQTNRATEHIASTTEQVAAGAEDQVKGMEETSSVINQMSASLSQISVNTQGVTESVASTKNKANVGIESIQVAESQMSSIQQNVNGLAGLVQGLGQRSQEIGQILEVITGIAAQTNLLALNAAIEAARAGEHGRGFAVVADEVRKLAEQSGTSAQQISNLIQQIQEETSRAVESMSKVTAEVTQGIQVVNHAGDSFSEIQQAVVHVTEQIEQVSSAIQDMTTGAQHVVENIETISRVIEETASGTQTVSAATEEQLASLEEITSSASSLSNMADGLNQLVGRFKL